MSFLHPKSIEDRIISLLKQGGMTTSDLLSAIRKTRGATTKQGFYTALRQLRKEEVVVVTKKMVSLHKAWIGDMRDEVQQTAEAYLVEEDTFGVLNLLEGESISYICGSAFHLDSFWGHLYVVLANAAPRSEPFFIYDPHYWFYLIREEHEYRYYEELARGEHQFLMCVGGNTPLDRLLRANFRDDQVQYHIASMRTKNTYYPTVVGDLVIEVFLDPVVAKQVDDVYARYTTITPELVRELNEILNLKSRNRIKISRDARKASLLKKKLSKYFYIKTPHTK